MFLLIHCVMSLSPYGVVPSQTKGAVVHKRLDLTVLLVCGIFASFIATASPADKGHVLQRGLDAYHRQDYATALREWRSLARQGDAEAQYNLGVMYERGEGVAKDEAEAVRWYTQAAAQGNADAQYNLGVMYGQGRGVAKDEAEAVRWYRKAAAQGDAGAQNLLEVMYGQGRGVAALLAPNQGQPRRALVIGNAAYPTSPLTNTVNDASDLATLLHRLGFDVTLHRDADKPTMEQAVDLFTQGVPQGSAGLFFFAGHGVQIDGVNYLLPIGAQFRTASDVKYRAIAADWVLARMDESGMAVKLLLLDACRDNPLGRSWTRALSGGLAVMETPKGALIAYATSPGKTASDGTGRNSPFTVELLRELGIPGRDVEVALKVVRAGVQQITNGQQIPWVASSMIGDFYVAR
jgi:TPR repeat protein